MTDTLATFPKIRPLRIKPGMFTMHRKGLEASIRALGICVASGIATFTLFLVMQGLVDFSDGARIEESTDFRMIDVVEDIPDITPRAIERKIEKPADVELPPDMPEAPTQVASNNVAGIDLSISVPRQTRSDIAFTNLAFDAGSDGDYLPLVVIQPQYPRKALERGWEGYVIIELTVAADGTVEPDSVVVVEAEPKRVFDRAAMQAARKFKYKPKVKDGKAIAVPGVSYKFSFTMAENQ